MLKNLDKIVNENNWIASEKNILFREKNAIFAKNFIKVPESN